MIESSLVNQPVSRVHAYYRNVLRILRNFKVIQAYAVKQTAPAPNRPCLRKFYMKDFHLINLKFAQVLFTERSWAPIKAAATAGA